MELSPHTGTAGGPRGGDLDAVGGGGREGWGGVGRIEYRRAMELRNGGEKVIQQVYGFSRGH